LIFINLIIVHGVSYKGVTKNNNLDVAEFQLASGRYRFEIKKGSLIVELVSCF